ncbi:phosphotransferase [Lentzea nigeriaca]|uniref:phosphotransferase n=1 Tax=Lentzea nigeriaca TaxID=1128665 RepID=UPI00195AFE65|nr:phosphotransferase [Lentzea nigeriaca]MBM7858712.1 hypothetical protein [Lentzea nigeriaca]
MISTEEAPAGRNSEIAVSLVAADGRFFCKGVKADDPQSFMHRNEAAVNPFLPEGMAPRLLWQIEEEGWLLLGFEHVSGQHANFSPDSPHLPMVADAVRVISTTDAPPTSSAKREMAKQWATALDRELSMELPVAAHAWSRENAATIAEWARRAPAYMDGATLIHSDLNPFNFLISDTARVVDWAWWRSGAPWIDAAQVAVRLIAAGHRPLEAEAWATQLDGFRTADPDGITAYTASLVRLWERKFAATDATEGARRWFEYRVSNR